MFKLLFFLSSGIQILAILTKFAKITRSTVNAYEQDVCVIIYHANYNIRPILIKYIE